MLPVALSIASLAATHGTNMFLSYLAIMIEFEASVRPGSTLPITTISGCASSESEITQLPAPMVAEDYESSGVALLPLPENESHGLSQEGRFMFSF